MSNEISTTRSYAVTVFAVGLLVVGLCMLFAPQEMGVSIFGRNDVEPLGSILGAALIGFAWMLWIARKSALGGIYGRTVVASNQAHFTIGALVLVKHGVAVSCTGAYWVLTVFYVVGALYFSYMLFGKGVRPPA